MRRRGVSQGALRVGRQSQRSPSEQQRLQHGRVELLMADSEGESNEEIDILSNTNDATPLSMMFGGISRSNQYQTPLTLGHLGAWQQTGAIPTSREQRNSRDAEESNSDESESSSGSESESDDDEDDDAQPTPLSSQPIRDIHPIKTRLDSTNSQDGLPLLSAKDGASKKKFDERFWEESPEVYGIRRSGRARKEPERYQEGSDEEEDSLGPVVRKKKPSTRNAKRARRISSSDDWPAAQPSTNDSTASDSSEDYTPRPTRPRPQPRARARAAANDSTPSCNRTTPSILKSSAARLKQQILESDESDSDDEASRNSLRRAAMNITSYKEESEDETDSEEIAEASKEWQGDYVEDDRETIERILLSRIGKPGQTGAITTIYSPDYEAIMNQELDPEKEPTEKHYLIKWKGWSHMHNTWESEATLTQQNVKGMKKLQNFMKREEDIAAWKKLASPEDIEYFEVQHEMNCELINEYKEVERIISHTSVKSIDEFGNRVNQVDYLCKWQGLPYSECTWEDGALTSRYFQPRVDDYLNRERSDKIPTKSAKVLRHRPKFSLIKKQPAYLGSNDSLGLRDYQLDGLNWLANSWCKGHSTILADEMGLGKTIQVISFLSHLFHAHSLYGPFIVVVPLSTLAAWQREFALWAPQLNVVVYIGDITSRNKIREYEFYHKNKKLKFNVLLSTYELLLKDKQILGTINWAGLIVDEAHRLKNDDSLLYKALEEFHTNHRLLVTGTPLQNSLKELWALLHFLMPDRFSSWEAFEEVHSTQEQKDKGFSSLHKELEPFLLRRVKKDVEKSLPAKVEQILRVEMSSLQKQYYRWILTKNFRALNKGLKGNSNSFLNIVMELKKCSNHAFLTRPDLTNPPGVDPLQNLIRGSGKLFLLDKLLVRLKETGHRVLIFSQMVRMLDILAEYLQKRRFLFQRLDGSIRGDLRKQALDHFNADGSEDFCFLLSTRAGGLGINLATADTVIIFDSDWNPQNDLQAQARAHRIGQQNQVNIYRFVAKGSVEEEILERAKRKMVLDHLIIQRMDTTGRKVLSKSSAAPSSSNPFNKEELASILKFGAEDLFKEGDGEQDLQLQEMDIDDILCRAETHDSDDQPQTIGDELLSQFKMANFAMDEEALSTPEPMQQEHEERAWEEIIPAPMRQKVQEEEDQKEQLALYLPPRSRKAVKKMNYDSEGEPRGRKKPARRKKSESESDEDGSEGDGKDTGKRKRGRPRTIKREDIEGFGDSEIRRFVKSYKKFGRPRSRLDAIAADAELDDKTVDEIIKIANTLHDGCIRAVKEYEEKLNEDENFDGKKRGATLRIGNVTINAPSILKHEEELEPLAAAIPSDPEEKKKYRLTLPAKSVHWGVPWDVSDDSMLLVGIHQHGIGNWEAIKANPTLDLTDKILPPGNLKPQDKHLQTRAEYLIKLLKQVVQENRAEELRKNTLKIKTKIRKLKKNLQKKQHSEDASPCSTAAPSPAMPVTSPLRQQENKEGGEVAEVSKPPPPASEGKKKAKPKPVKKKTVKPPLEEKEKPAPKEKINEKEVVEQEEENQPEPPPEVEETTEIVSPDDAEHEQLGSYTDMDKETFNACKEKMRPVKRALKMLESPEDHVTVKDQVAQTRQCLLKIGDHIMDMTSQYRDHEVASEWRGNLWTFVSKFTSFEAKKLFKLYRHAVKKREELRQQHQQERAHHHKLKHDAPPNTLPRKTTATADHSTHRPTSDLKRGLESMSLPASATKIPKLDASARAGASSGSSRYAGGSAEAGHESHRPGKSYGERPKDRPDRPSREGHDDRQRYYDRDRDRDRERNRDRDRSNYHGSEHPRTYERSSDHSRSKDSRSRSYERSSDHHSRSYDKPLDKNYDKSYDKSYRRDDHHRSSFREHSSEHRHQSYSHRTSSESSRHSGQSPDGVSSPRTSYENRKHYSEEKRDRDKR